MYINLWFAFLSSEVAPCPLFLSSKTWDFIVLVTFLGSRYNTVLACKRTRNVYKAHKLQHQVSNIFVNTISNSWPHLTFCMRAFSIKPSVWGQTRTAWFHPPPPPQSPFSHSQSPNKHFQCKWSQMFYMHTTRTTASHLHCWNSKSSSVYTQSTTLQFPTFPIPIFQRLLALPLFSSSSVSLTESVMSVSGVRPSVSVDISESLSFLSWLKDTVFFLPGIL